MGKFDGVLLCSDLDQTLTNNKGIITSNVIDSIHYFQQNGGTFTIATGRLPAYLSKYVGLLSIKAPIICHNGATIYSYETKSFLRKSYLNPQVSELLNFVYKNYDCVQFFHFHSLEVTHTFSASQKEELLEAFYTQDWCKVVLHMDSEDNAIKLRDDLRSSIYGDQYSFVRSWPIGLEILGIGSSKGDSVKILRTLIPNINKVICVGNYENDITMLEYADIGYAVQNACKDVLDAADRITVSNDEDAIAHIISEL